MKVSAVFDMVSVEYEIEVPDNANDEEIRNAVIDWLDDNLEEVYASIRESEIWPRSIEKED